MKTNNQDIFQITEVDQTVFKRSSSKETLDIQNCSLDSPDYAMDDGSLHDAFEPKGRNLLNQSNPKGESSQERSNHIHLTLMWSLTKFMSCSR